MNNVICHIAGPSGSGKTTLLEEISKQYPNIKTVDLDEIDDNASLKLGLDSINKQNFSDQDLKNLNDLKQKMFDEILENNNNIVVAGIFTEGIYRMDIPTKNKFLLDIDAKTSAKRAYERSQKEEEKYRRKIEDLPLDVEDAKKEIEFLLKENYLPKNKSEILDFIKNLNP